MVLRSKIYTDVEISGFLSFDCWIENDKNKNYLHANTPNSLYPEGRGTEREVVFSTLLEHQIQLRIQRDGLFILKPEHLIEKAMNIIEDDSEIRQERKGKEKHHRIHQLYAQLLNFVSFYLVSEMCINYEFNFHGFFIGMNDVQATSVYSLSNSKSILNHMKPMTQDEIHRLNFFYSNDPRMKYQFRPIYVYTEALESAIPRLNHMLRTDPFGSIFLASTAKTVDESILNGDWDNAFTNSFLLVEHLVQKRYIATYKSDIMNGKHISRNNISDIIKFMYKDGTITRKERFFIKYLNAIRNDLVHRLKPINYLSCSVAKDVLLCLLAEHIGFKVYMPGHR